MYIYGDQSVHVPENLSFSKFMLDKLRAVKGDKICLENGLTRERLTYKEVTQYAVNLSAALSNLGVGRGDVVAIGSKPFLHYIPTALAILFTGATYTAYDESLGAAVLKHRLDLAKPKYLICSSTFLQKYKSLINSFDCIKIYIGVDDVPYLKISLTSLISMQEDVDVEIFEPAPVEVHSDTVLIAYSTGTTNMPKGIKRSHFNELSSVVLRGFENMTSLKTVLIIRSWSIHIYTSVSLKCISLGRKIVFAYGLPVATTLQILRDCKVDAFFITPEYVREMANSSHPSDNYFENLKTIHCAGSPLKAEMVEVFRKSFPNVDIRQCYGSTECEEVTRCVPGDNPKPGSIGRVCPGAIVKVVDPKTRALLGPKQVVEICIKGPTLTQGYINLNFADYVDEDNFFKSGDLGYYDEDNDFFFLDRFSNFMLWNGYKVSPGELENVLLQHPAVFDVGVIGRPAPMVHEVPMAFVVKKPGTNVSEEELISFVASQVSSQMQLRGGVVFISEVPRSEGGKLLRHELKGMLNTHVTDLNSKAAL